MYSIGLLFLSFFGFIRKFKVSRGVNNATGRIRIEDNRHILCIRVLVLYLSVSFRFWFLVCAWWRARSFINHWPLPLVACYVVESIGCTFKTSPFELFEWKESSFLSTFWTVNWIRFWFNNTQNRPSNPVLKPETLTKDWFIVAIYWCYYSPLLIVRVFSCFTL